MSALLALAYVSTSSQPVDALSVEAMLERFRTSNRQAGITGVLLYCNGSYMQYLEGPEEAVRATYRKVSRDPRHHGVTELLNTPVDAREFGEWDMGYSTMGAETFWQLVERPWTRSSSPGGSVMHELLKTFWERNTRSRSSSIS